MMNRVLFGRKLPWRNRPNIPALAFRHCGKPQQIQGVTATQTYSYIVDVREFKLDAHMNTDLCVWGEIIIYLSTRSVGVLEFLLSLVFTRCLI
jgi:hypothetical protein